IGDRTINAGEEKHDGPHVSVDGERIDQLIVQISQSQLAGGRVGSRACNARRKDEGDEPHAKNAPKGPGKLARSPRDRVTRKLMLAYGHPPGEPREARSPAASPDSRAASRTVHLA